MSFTYEATFSMDRWHGVPNNWVECDGIRLESNIALSIISDMCVALLEAGRPDGSIAFYEDGYIEPSYTYPSVQEIVFRMKASENRQQPAVRTPRPMAAATEAPPSNMPVVSKATHSALLQLSVDRSSWNKLHGRTRSVLLDNGFVSVDNDELEFTELGQAVLAGSQDEYPTDINKADETELLRAAKMIGLKPASNIARTLSFIEANISRYSITDLEERAWKVKVSVRMGRCKTDDMRKRRILAAISNAGKLAEAL